MDNKFSIGEMVKFLRLQKDLTLRDLADQSGVSYSQLSKIERGENHPSKESVEALAACLDVDTELLLIVSGYAPDNLKQLFIEELVSSYKNYIMTTNYDRDMEMHSYKSSLNLEQTINKYASNIIRYKPYDTDFINQMLGNLSAINTKRDRNRMQAWRMFIEQMEDQGKTPDDLFKMLDDYEVMETKLRQIEMLLWNHGESKRSK